MQVHPGDAEERNMALLEDNVAKERLIEELEAAAIADRDRSERSAAVNNELEGALAKASTDLDETRQRLVEALDSAFATKVDKEAELGMSDAGHRCGF
jgi:NCAIR mutase (PurE)-related protein